KGSRKIHNDPITSIKFSNQKNYLITTSDDCYLKVFHIDHKKELKLIRSVRLSDQLKSIQVIEDQQRIVASDSSGYIKFWSLNNLKSINTMKLEADTDHRSGIMYVKKI